MIIVGGIKRLTPNNPAEQFAEASKSDLGQILTAGQGQFEIEDRDQNTPYIKKLRVVTTITYSLDD